ncbi:MAG: PIN domain-containing protein [Actinomycetota bacterium]
MAGLTLDSGALIAAQRNERRIWNLLRETVAQGVVVSVPAAALAQVWRGSPSARLAQVLGNSEVVPIDEVLAKRTGELLAVSKTSDVADASVVVTAARTSATIVTSDPDDMRRLTAHVSGVEVLDLKELPRVKK